MIIVVASSFPSVRNIFEAQQYPTLSHIYLIRIVYIVSVIELIFITPAFDKAFPVRTTFDTVPTWMA